jgi:hypothetical protein
LLLYTDGLVEVEGQDLSVNVEHLQAILGRADRPEVEDVCAAIPDTQLPGSRGDDVAILLVKLTHLPTTGGPAAEMARATP